MVQDVSGSQDVSGIRYEVLATVKIIELILFHSVQSSLNDHIAE